jgi:ABC-type Mn2+/Zn2+ transport system permease subunit
MWLDPIFEPFQYQFMVRALIVCISVGVICPFLGAHVINREMGFMGDALSHAVLPGIVAAYAIGLSPLIGAIPMGIIVALLIGFLVKKSNISHDTSIGILFTGLFALGLILLSVLGGAGINLEHILLGQVLSTSNIDVYVTLGLSLLTLALMILLHKQMVFVGFDYQGAVVAGLPAARINYLLLVLLSIVIVVTLQVVGIILVVAMLITPAAASSLIAKRFSRAIVLGVLFGVIAAVVGLYLSYYFNLPSGPSIALTSTAIFALAFLKRWQASGVAGAT